MALPLALVEVALVVAPIGPIILSVTMGFAHYEVSLVDVSVCKTLDALAVLQTLLELSFVTVSVDPYVNTVAICLSELPLPDVAVSLCAFPHTRTVFEATKPFSFVKLSVWPLVLPYSFWLPVDKMTLIDAAICLLLVPSPVFVVTSPLAFINAIIAVEHDALSLPFVIDYLAIVGSLSVFLDFEVLGSVECMDVDYVGPRTIGFEPRENVLVSHQTGYGS